MRSLRFIVLPLLSLFHSQQILAATLLNGAESILLNSFTSDACLNAFQSTSLDCNTTLLQEITFHSESALTTNELSDLCTSPCVRSLEDLETSVSYACGTHTFPFDGNNMSYVEMVNYYQYRHGIVCLKDNSTGDFCADIEARWNISAMVAAANATWPEHTTKIYPDTDSVLWPPMIDSDGTTSNPWTDSPRMYGKNASDLTSSDEMTIRDFLYDTSSFDDTNYGWAAALEFDEYPLEIQCSSCFVDKFIYGLSTVWGDVFDNITSQVWENMKSNCELSSVSFVPANNLTGKGVGKNNAVPDIPALQCGQNITVDAENACTCSDIALVYSVPSSSIPALNWINCASIVNASICLPQSCDLARNAGEGRASVSSVLNAYSNFTKPQFLAWNEYMGNSIDQDEFFCVGPPGGLFTPTFIGASGQDNYTTTALPAHATPSGTVANCGLYYDVQSGDYCDLIATKFSITFDELRALNPSINTDCTNLYSGYDYCVALVNGTSVTSTSVHSSTASSMSSSMTIASASQTSGFSSTSTNVQSMSATSSSGSAPGPTQSGTNPQCTQYHEVISGDYCYAIETMYDITFAQFQAWNPTIDSGCSNLQIGYAYCVGVPSSSMIISTSMSSTSIIPSSSSGVTSTSSASVSSRSIASLSSITASYSSGVISTSSASSSGSSIIPSSPITSTVVQSSASLSASSTTSSSSSSTSTSSTAISSSFTSSPMPSSTTSQCYTWYTVVSGDYCYKIEQQFGITFDQFRTWNPVIDSDCSNLQVGQLYCVNASSAAPAATEASSSAMTTSSSAPASSSSSTITSTGVSTDAPPGPTGSGTTTACQEWYVVVSGDYCYKIYTQYAITFAQFRGWNGNVDSSCSNLVVGNAYCVSGP